MNLMAEGIKPLRAMVPDVPADVAALVKHMLARQRADRPRDMGEVTRVLALYARPEPWPLKVSPKAVGETRSTVPVSQTPQPVPVAARPPPRRSAVVMTAAGVLVLGLGAWGMTRPGLVRRAAAQGQGGEQAVASLAAPPIEAPAPAERAPSPVPPVATMPSPVGAPPRSATTRPSPSETSSAAAPREAHAAGRPPSTKPVAEMPPDEPMPAPSADPSRPVAPPATSAEPADCDPPYEFDATGKKVWKRRCL
jgi:hypothetical protein